MLKYRLPTSVWVASALFTFLVAVSSFQIRGVGEPEGYILNTNLSIPVNTYEDDGAINIFLSLGLDRDFSSWSKYVLNVGCPFILSTRSLIRLADWLGLATRFDEPSLYLLYPEKLVSIWRIISLYKAALLFCCPVVLFWIGRNFYSERTGVLAAWLMAFMPFPMGFEARDKVDLLAITCGLLSIFYQMAYARDRHVRHLLAAGATLGLSVAFKIIMVPATFTMLAAFFLSRDYGRRLTWPSCKPLFWALLTTVAVYLAANPFFLPGLLPTLHKYSSDMMATQASGLGDVLGGLTYRLAHFDSLLGGVTPWLLSPAMLLLLYRLLKKVDGWRQKLLPPLFIILDLIYLSALMQERIAVFTYYYYGVSVVLLLIVAYFLDEAGNFLTRHKAALVYPVLVALVMFVAFRDQMNIMRYMFSPTNRQLAHEWISQHVPVSSSVGIPLRPGSELFNSKIRVDPFRYDLVPIGAKGEHLLKSRPEFVLWERNSPLSPTLLDPEYSLVADFDLGKNLPHERYDLYQEEAFSVYQLIAPSAKGQTEPSSFEARLGEYLRQHNLGTCNLLQHQALYFYPISMNLMRLDGDTLQPFASGSFFSSIRQPEDPPAYPHTIDPTLLDVWGVKYLLARTDPPGGFMEQTVGSGYYSLEEKWHTERVMADGSLRPVVLMINGEYKGQALFAPDPGKVFEAQTREGFLGFARRPLLPYGRFFSQDQFRELGVKTLEIGLDFTCDQAVDVILKGGKRRQSLSLGPGSHVLHTVYTVGNAVEDLGYEINPVQGKKTDIRVKSLRVAPLVLQGAPVVRCETLTPKWGFAQVQSESPGRVIFSMPYHKRWRAEVDGNQVDVLPDISGTLAVPVPAGEHFVALICE